MVTVKHVIADELGIHARPAGLLVKQLSGFSGNVQLGSTQKMVDGKRLFSVMSLGLKQGDEMRLTFEGPGEENAAAEAEAFLKANL